MADGADPGNRPTFFEHLCDEAQADGVPCTERGRKCETCERARRRPPQRPPAPPPGSQADGHR